MFVSENILTGVTILVVELLGSTDKNCFCEFKFIGEKVFLQKLTGLEIVSFFTGFIRALLFHLPSLSDMT